MHTYSKLVDNEIYKTLWENEMVRVALSFIMTFPSHFKPVQKL